MLVGLGNPGPRYVDTRHNLGYRVAEAFASRHGTEHFRSDGDRLEARLRVGGEEMLVVKPLTFMNESGVAVKRVLAKHGVEPEDLLVAHDDLDIELGEVRLKRGGGHGGHNGLRSILAETGESEFVRLRLGIRRPEPSRDAAAWVLTPFAEDEYPVVAAMVERGADAAAAVWRLGLPKAMNEFNRRTEPAGLAALPAPGRS